MSRPPLAVHKTNGILILTKGELSQLNYIKREIERQKYRLAEYVMKIAELKTELDINVKKYFFDCSV